MRRELAAGPPAGDEPSHEVLMKSCDRIQRNAYKYLEGVLSQREQEEIKTHLQSCPQCAAALAWAKRTRQMLHTLPKHTPSANFDIVLHAKMRHAEYERRSIWPLTMPGWIWQAPAYGAAALLLIAAGVFIDRQLELSPSLSTPARMAVEEQIVVPHTAAPGAETAAGKRESGGESTTLGSRLAETRMAATDAQKKSALPLQQFAAQEPVKRYVMQKIPMQSLLRENRRLVGNRQANLEQLAFDTMLVREPANRGRNVPGVQAVNASVQF
jgi:anti-sigma factor RsiW